MTVATTMYSGQPAVKPITKFYQGAQDILKKNVEPGELTALAIRVDGLVAMCRQGMLPEGAPNIAELWKLRCEIYDKIQSQLNGEPARDETEYVYEEG